MMETPSPWGKTSVDGKYHALVAHSMDVAAVFEGLVGQHVLHARLEKAAGRALSPTDVARLAALVFLHDIGKLPPGFQAKARADPAHWPGASVNHSSAGAGFFRQAYPDIGHPFADIIKAMKLWGDVTDTLLMAIFAHHGRPVEPSMTHKDYWPVVGGYDWHFGAITMAEALRTAFPGAFSTAQNLPEAPAFIMLRDLRRLQIGLAQTCSFFHSTPTLIQTIPLQPGGLLLLPWKQLA